MLRRTIVFSGGFLSRIYSTLLGYELGGHRAVLVLRTQGAYVAVLRSRPRRRGARGSDIGVLRLRGSQSAR